MRIPKEYRTGLALGCGDFDDCLVHYYASKPEPSVNWPGGIEIEGVWFEDEGCILDRMTDAEVSELETELADYEADRALDFEEGKAEAMMEARREREWELK